MAATFRAVMVMKKGGPEALQIVELPVAPPGPGQLRVRVRAAGVGATDLLMLSGKYRYAPKIPLVPGYEIAGVVDAIGAGVAGFMVGDRVAALTVYGGFAELLVREAGDFLPIPDDVSDRDAAAVILNFVTAWQMIHRVAKVKPGQTALVTGAAGGVGTAALQPFSRLMGVKAYGAASTPKHGDASVPRSATPIDYRAGPLDRLTRALEPQGVDYVFDAIGGANIGPCTRRLSGGAGCWWDLGSWGPLPSCPNWRCSRIFSSGRACAGGKAGSMALHCCIGKTRSRYARISPGFFRCSRSTKLIH